MKLYAATLSPYVARVRLALRLKGLEVEMLPPPGGSTRSPEYLAISPIGKIPVLVTDDGLVIPESEVIIDWLEAHYPAPSLLPEAAGQQVQMAAIIRCLELYATPAMSRLFAQIDPAARDAARCAAEIAELRNGLALTAHFVAGDQPFAASPRPSKADCILLPSLFLAGVAGEFFGVHDMVADYPRLVTYRERALRHPDMRAIWDETAAALRAWQAKNH